MELSNPSIGAQYQRTELTLLVLTRLVFLLRLEMIALRCAALRRA